MKHIVLVDFHQWSQTRLPYKLLLAQLSKLGSYKIVGFRSVKIGYSIFPNHSLDQKSLGKSDKSAKDFYETHLGVEEFIHPKTNRWLQKVRGIWLPRAVRKALGSASELESMEIRGVPVGDLIYDAYCNHEHLATPNNGSAQLRRFLVDAVYLVKFWDRYFRKNSVLAVLGETVYLQGIPLRIAQKYGATVFVANLKGLERIDTLNPFEDSLFQHYPELAELLPAEDKSVGINQAEESLRQLLAGGQVDRINLYSGPSAFAQPDESLNVPYDGRESIIIAPHDFFDSSHSKGPHLYADFYIWLWRLGELSRHVDLNWWLKPHPLESERTRKILDEFLADFPHIRELPGKVNPRTLETLRVKTALTVRGTIAGEYPLIGIPVINASQSNMHHRYDFSITPRSREEYEALILNLGQESLVPETRGLSEFFFLRHILEYSGTFLPPDQIASRSWDVETDVIEIWRQLGSVERARIESRVRDFLESGAHWMRGALLAGLDGNGLLWADAGPTKNSAKFPLNPQHHQTQRAKED